MSIETLTFGCRLNTAESETMQRLADASGLGDALIVNTCAVTAEAVRQARQAIRRAHREQPDRPIIVTGCAVETETEAFAAMPEITRLIGNADKLDPARWRAGFGLSDDAKPRIGDIMRVRAHAGHMAAAFDGQPALFSRSAEWLRPPLHLLHYPVWPGAVTLRAYRRGGGGGEAAGRARRRRNRAHRR